MFPHKSYWMSQVLIKEMSHISENVPAFVHSSELPNLFPFSIVLPYVQLCLCATESMRQILCLQEKGLSSSFFKMSDGSFLGMPLPIFCACWDGSVDSPSFPWEEEDFQGEFNLKAPQLLTSNLRSMCFPCCTIVVNTRFLSFLPHFIPLPYLPVRSVW